MTLYIVVPPGIEPGTQGQLIDNVSPLLYQLSYGTCKQKRVTPKNDSFQVVPPGIEPGTQGQLIDNVSPLLYQLSMARIYTKKSHSEE